MTTLLRLDTSILGKDSVSRRLLDEFQAGLQESLGPFEVIQRDFSKESVPHLDADWLRALSTPAGERSSEQQRKVDYSDTLIRELQSADLLLIGLPMYNFSVPSMLKAWNDHVARAGVTFAYSESGPRGLLTGKRAYLFTAMGGQHEAGGSDFLRPYMKQFLGFLGIREIEFITASGLSMGEEQRQAGLNRALLRIHELTRAERQEQVA